jgi:ribonucleoside-triphosphate reductase
MCCRLRLDLRTLEKRGGGLFGSNPLTGSIGVVTINMPRIGHLARDEGDFIARLDALMEIARTSLETKRKALETLMDKDFYPYSKFYLRDVKERFDRYWNNHFSTVGLVGLNEACLNLLGEDIGTEKGAGFAARVLDHMRHELTRFQTETGNLYNLEATPGEGTSHRLARLDRNRFSDIITANDNGGGDVSDTFYTNSSQLPVDYSTDVFEVLDLQDHLQTRYTGGTVQHIFLGEAASDPEAVKVFVKTVCSTYHLPYFTISPTFSVCPNHGYLAGEHPACPHCDSESEIYSRVVGYLRPINQWNEGKQAEFSLRSRYTIESQEGAP